MPPGGCTGGGVGQDRAEGEDVTGRRRGPPLDLFRGEIAWRADDRAGRGEALGVLRNEGDAEVDHPRAVVGQEHIPRLEVPVHQPDTVDLDEGDHQPDGEAPQALFRQRAGALHDFLQAWPRHVHRRQPWRCRARIGVHDRRGVGARHPARRLDLANEADAEAGVFHKPGQHLLDRGQPPVGPDSQEDPAHPPGPDHTDEPVAADDPWLAVVQFPHASPLDHRAQAPPPRPDDGSQALSGRVTGLALRRGTNEQSGSSPHEPSMSFRIRVYHGLVGQRTVTCGRDSVAPATGHPPLVVGGPGRRSHPVAAAPGQLRTDQVQPGLPTSARAERRVPEQPHPALDQRSIPPGRPGRGRSPGSSRCARMRAVNRRSRPSAPGGAASARHPAPRPPPAHRDAARGPAPPRSPRPPADAANGPARAPRCSPPPPTPGLLTAPCSALRITVRIVR